IPDTSRKLLKLLCVDLAFVLCEINLAEADAFGRYLNVFVRLDVLHGLFQRKLDGRCYPDVIVAAGSPHVSQLLALYQIDHQIIITDMFAYDLTLINLDARLNKEPSAILQLIDGISGGLPLFHGDQNTCQTAGNGSFPGLIGLETVCHYRLAGRSGEYVVPQADDTP